jgi:SM-20-related protein
MLVTWPDFVPTTFSFHDDPVLVIENFWTTGERKLFRDAMQRSSWQPLRDMPLVHAAFPNCGNWGKGSMARPEVSRLLERLALPYIEHFMESFPDITGRSLSFSYYSYGSGDCLLTHDDTAQSGSSSLDAQRVSRRRLALVSYVHEEWEADWGGELIIYKADRQTGTGRPKLHISHCIAPEPGSLVLFTVPRFHRVCRVDPIAGEHARLSIAGWLLTEHTVSHRLIPQAAVALVGRAQGIASRE